MPLERLFEERDEQSRGVVHGDVVSEVGPAHGHLAQDVNHILAERAMEGDAAPATFGDRFRPVAQEEIRGRR